MIEDDIWTASTSISQNMPSNDIISNSSTNKSHYIYFLDSEDIDRKISKPTRSKKNKKSVHTTQNDSKLL